MVYEPYRHALWEMEINNIGREESIYNESLNNSSSKSEVDDDDNSANDDV